MSSTVTDPRPDRDGDALHAGFTYGSREAYVSVLTRFIQGGIDADEPVAVAVPPTRLEWLRSGLDQPTARRVRWVDMSEAGRNPGRILPAVILDHVREHPGTPVRFVGEPIWPGRGDEEYPACLQHEALINPVLSGLPATVVCPYDERLPEPVRTDSAATHPVFLDGDGQRPSPDYDWPAAYDAGNQPLPAPAGARRVRFGAHRVRRARDNAALHARWLRFADQSIGEIALAVDELATNSVLHGGGGGVLELWEEPAYLVCQVTDDGHLADPLAGRRPAPVTQVGGRGLLLVNELADLVRAHTTPCGTTIRVYFRRH